MATTHNPLLKRSDNDLPDPTTRWTTALVTVPLAWLVVTIVHPMGGGDAYEELHDKVGLWLAVHLAQLLLALALAAMIWCAIKGRRGTAATVVRIALPVWLVSFSTFDAATGIGTGLAVRHANGLSDAERAGAASAAHHLVDNRITGDFSPVWFVQAIALLTAIIATALMLRAAGGSRPSFVAALLGTLLVFHAGPIAAVDLLGITVATVQVHREGLIHNAVE